MSSRARAHRRTASRSPLVRLPRRSRLETITADQCDAIFNGVLTFLNDVGMLVENAEVRVMLTAAGMGGLRTCLTMI